MYPAQACANTQLESTHICTRHQNFCLKLHLEYISLSVCLKCRRLKSDSQHRHVLILNKNQNNHVKGIKLLSQVTLSRPLSVNLFEVLNTEIWSPAQTCANTQLESAHTCTRHQIIVTSYSLSTFHCQFVWSEVLKSEIWFPAQTCANTQLKSTHTSTRHQIIVSCYPLSTFHCQFVLSEVLKSEIWFPAQTCADTQLESEQSCKRHQIIVTSYPF